MSFIASIGTHKCEGPRIQRGVDSTVKQTINARLISTQLNEARYKIFYMVSGWRVDLLK